METLCSMCSERKETQYFDLYISGSEGTRLCYDCEKLVVRFIQDKRLAAFRKRKAEHLKRQQVAQDDPAHLDKIGTPEDIDARLQYEEAKA